MVVNFQRLVTYIFFEEQGIHDFKGSGHHHDYKFSLSTNEFDITGQELYENDIVKYVIYSDEVFIGIVKFGIYEQDGSGGEYSGRKCQGFYIEQIDCLIQDYQDEEDREWLIRSFQKTVSIYEPDKIEKIGNIYENPELINR